MSENLHKGLIDPYKKGFCDGIFGRPAESPWRDDGYPAMKKNEQYISGYLEGQKRQPKEQVRL